MMPCLPILLSLSASTKLANSEIRSKGRGGQIPLTIKADTAAIRLLHR